MGFKINNNPAQWWRASEGWTTWARATRYASQAAADRAYERAEAQGAAPVGVHPTSSGEPAWSRHAPRPVRYVTGKNEPGFLPNEEPRGPWNSWRDAVADLKSDIESEVDSAFEGSDQEPEYLASLEAARDSVFAEIDAEPENPRGFDIRFQPTGMNFFIYPEA